MSFQGLTPEALVQRNDSKNPATTCKGLTTSGRPCRRSLASTPSSSPAPSPGTSPVKNRDGVVAVLNEGDAAAYFCWQHQDQAQNLISKIRQEKQKTTILPIRKQNSIDSLAEKVGVLDLDADEEQNTHRLPRKKVRVKKRDTLPAEWQQMQGPLMTVPEDARESLEIQRPPQRKPSRPPPRSNVRFSWACCIRGDDDYHDDGPPSRKRTDHRRNQHRPSQSMSMNEPHQYTSPSRPLQPQTPTRLSPRPITVQTPPHSETQNYLSYIPPHLDPTTTSTLLTELSKPFAKDDEPGYIYIFWLTPSSEPSVPDDDIASTILDGDLDYQDLGVPRSYNRQGSSSRARDRASALSRYASVKQDRAPPKILLKIGRAQNVHRRMTQWTKQCNQNITLVRYYPHYASAAADAASPGGAKVPHVNRVERLIHVELRGLGMGKEKEKCPDCGREHREWFEVEATRAGLKSVDEIVRRWVSWGENNEAADS